MQSSKAFQANDPIELAKNCTGCVLIRDVVARSENVCGIETNTKALRLVHVHDDVCEMLEAMSKTRALPSSGFERDLCFHFWDHPKNRVDRLHNPIQAGFFTSGHV